jgi:hypothetical protein
MKKVFLVTLLLSGSFLLAQDSNPANSQPKSKDEVTIRGCVSRANGDYILMKQDPAVTYELQPTGKTKLHNFLGQRVEVTGTQGASMSTSSDAMTRSGSASPVTLTITSIKTIDKDCPVREVPDK